MILAAAAVFRITAAFADPFTTQDLYRYRWEGKLQAAGGNPYLSPPNDPALTHLRDDTFENVNGKDFRAVYGPLLQLIEHATYQAASAATADSRLQIQLFKIPAALADLGTVATLLWWLRRRGLPLAGVAVYAWSPLAIWEFWGTGHNDAILLFFMALSFALASAGRSLPAYLALAAAVATKLWLAMLLPKLWLTTGRKWTVLLVVPLWAALAWPYLADVTENAQFVSGFLGGWRNNDSLFGLILAVTADPYQAKYVAFGILAVVAGWMTFSNRPRESAALVMIAAMLAVSSNVHPWYLTWLLPFLVFHPNQALLAWTALAPIGYVVLLHFFATNEWNGLTPWRWAIYLPVAILLVFPIEKWTHRGTIKEVPDKVQ